MKLDRSSAFKIAVLKKSWLINRSKLRFDGAHHFILKDKKFFKTDQRGGSGNYCFLIASLDNRYEDVLIVTPQEFYKHKTDDLLGERGVLQHLYKPAVYTTTKALQEDQAVKEIAKSVAIYSIVLLIAVALIFVGIGVTLYAFILAPVTTVSAPSSAALAVTSPSVVVSAPS